MRTSSVSTRAARFRDITSAMLNGFMWSRMWLEITYSRRNSIENMRNSVTISMPVSCLAPLGARTIVDKMMLNIGSRIATVLAIKRLTQQVYGPACTGSNVALQWRHNEHPGVSNHRRLDCLINRLFGLISKENLKARVIGPLWGKPPVIGGFSLQKASNVETVSTSWRHHALPPVMPWDTLTPD